MRFFVKTLILCLLSTACRAAIDPPVDAQTDSLTAVENRLTELDAELNQLARFTLRSGVGNLGWFSNTQKKDGEPEWAEIKLPADAQFDRIVLAPVLWNDAVNGPQADGFPQAFEVVAGTENDTEGRVIARFGPDDHFLPRIAPLIIDLPPTTATWVRIQSSQLSPHARNKAHRFKLSEIMIFSGQQNIALNRPVRVSSTTRTTVWGAGAIYKEALVDGLTPFVMDTPHGTRSDHYLAVSNTKTPLSFIIDLGNSQRINGIRFHSADIQEFVPQINPSDFGIPTHLTVKGANQPDFSDAELLLDYHRDSVFQAGNIMEWTLPEIQCRYVRLTVPKDGWPLDASKQQYCISWAEIEILSDGKNVAKGKSILDQKRLPLKHRRIFALTDGSNHFGTILPTREWMEQLARRHDLETERPLISDELNHRYARQKSNLRLMTWLAALLAAGIAFTILIERVLRLRAVLKIRERIAANLHDELSANLHAVVLLSDMAQSNVNKRTKLEDILERINHLSKRSRNAARYCTNMLQADSICDDLVKEMNHSAHRLLADIQHELQFEGEPFIEQLSKRKRIDLFLFYKECLTNIARHAEASSCTTQLSGTAAKIQLIVTDNGRGVTETPPSLKRRAQLLRAPLKIETPESGGTRIILTLKRNRFGLQKQ